MTTTLPIRDLILDHIADSRPKAATYERVVDYILTQGRGKVRSTVFLTMATRQALAELLVLGEVVNEGTQEEPQYRISTGEQKRRAAYRLRHLMLEDI